MLQFENRYLTDLYSELRLVNDLLEESIIEKRELEYRLDELVGARDRLTNLINHYVAIRGED